MARKPAGLKRSRPRGWGKAMSTRSRATLLSAVLGAALPVPPTVVLLWGCDPPEEDELPVSAAQAPEPAAAESAPAEVAAAEAEAEAEPAGVTAAGEDSAEAEEPAPIGVR